MDAESIETSLATTLANNSSDEHKQWVDNVPRVLYKELPIVYNLVGAVLNAILIIYFIKSGKYKSPIFTILTSLALMDFLTCLSAAGYAGFLFPYMTTDATFLCPLIAILSNIGLVGSEYHLVFFAALRLYQMASPLSARARVTADLMAKICFMIVIVVSIFMIAYCLHYRGASFVYRGQDVLSCMFFGDEQARNVALLATTVVLPCAAILILHVSKHCIVSKAPEVTKQERRNTDARAVTIVIALFFITWIPVHAFLIIRKLGIVNAVDTNLSLVLQYLVFSNSLMNPIVYCFAVKSVRDDMKRVFCHMCVRKHGQ